MGYERPGCSEVLYVRNNKDFVIDATFKGNALRFLNHSCAPNCKLEKWQVEGEVRVGVFASKSIKVGEALTYDYLFVQFGPEVECRCGAPSCNGYLGTKRKIVFAQRLKGGRNWLHRGVLKDKGQQRDM
ncbi:histone-lysine n-methyltransferase ashh3 [Phtheirospermum japonicum]|uniref:Histone-lysine n-methyltransferase ashh3 n=1 Tax=Phtheirospermum japonicum TaxID=374723 RepID=A0A830CKM0_9LAMI|nr:histone-lysine n-methyltransferase ashh3 [Phtheirospermum japonicum]